MNKSIKNIFLSLLFTVIVLVVFLFGVRIDASAVTKTTTIDTGLQLRSVIENGDKVYISSTPYAYGYAGYIDGANFGFTGVLGNSKILVDISDDAFSVIPDGATIVGATFSVYQYAAPDTSTNFQCSMILDSWNVDDFSQSNQSKGYTRASTLSAEYLTSEASLVGYHNFDIRTAVNNWINGLSEQNGLIITGQYGTSSEIGGAFVTNTATDDTEGQATYFYNKPYITVTWECAHSGETCIEDAIEATCTTAGYSGDTYCIDCDEMFTGGEEIPALGHIDENGDLACDRCTVTVLYNGACGAKDVDLAWEYNVINKTLTIFGTGDMEDYYISSYAPWYAYRDSIEKIVLEEGVTSIGNLAFYTCRNATEISLPETLARIGTSALNGCDSLTEVYIPAAVAEIGSKAFHSCDLLEAITVSEDNVYYACADGVLFNKDMTALIKYPDGKTDTEYSIPETVTSISAHAFNGSEYITAISITSGIDTIENSAFYACKNLASVVLGDCVTTIEPYAFYGCKKLTDLTFTNSITSIGNWAFYACSNLSEVNFGGTEEEWSAYGLGTDNKHLKNASVVYTESPGEETLETVSLLRFSLRINKCEHTYESLTVEATCTLGGYTTHACTSCGDSYTDSFTETAEHSFDAKGVCESCGFDNTVDCTCICHSDGLMRIIYRLMQILWKFFKLNQSCGCNAVHY